MKLVSTVGFEGFDKSVYAFVCARDETQQGEHQNKAIPAEHHSAWALRCAQCTDNFNYWRENQSQTRWT